MVLDLMKQAFQIFKNFFLSTWMSKNAVQIILINRNP